MMNSEELQFLLSPGEPVPISIAYHYDRPSDNRPTFMWFCGFKSEMTSSKAEAIAAWAQQNGAGCLRFDYSGHGQSGGSFEQGTITAWQAQAALVLERAAPPGPVVFVGSSMGGWIALILAQQLMTASPTGGGKAAHLQGIVLIAPAWDMTSLMWDNAPEDARTAVLRDGVYLRPSAYGDGPYPITRTLIEDGEKHKLANSGLVLKVPIRILHGCDDPDIPWPHSLNLLGLIDCPDVRLTLIKDGEHRLSRPKDLALLNSTLAEFL